MKKFYIVVALLVIGAGAFAITRPNNTSSDNTTTSSKPNAFADIQSDIAKGALLYDVRTPAEYASGHFASSKNLSLQDMQAGKLPNVSKTSKIYVYCQSGNRAGQAYSLLKANGYTNVASLGGLADVKSMGGKLVTN